jgi:hypothetical protein
MPASPAQIIPADDPLAVEVVTAIRAGDVTRLDRLLEDNPRLARAQIADPAAMTPGRCCTSPPTGLGNSRTPRGPSRR